MTVRLVLEIFNFTVGCNVLIASRKLDRLQEATKELSVTAKEGQSRLEVMQCNIRKETEVSNREKI